MGSEHQLVDEIPVSHGPASFENDHREQEQIKEGSHHKPFCFHVYSSHGPVQYRAICRQEYAEQKADQDDDTGFADYANLAGDVMGLETAEMGPVEKRVTCPREMRGILSS